MKTNSLPYILTDSSLSVVVRGKPVVVTKSNGSFAAVVEAVRKGDVKQVQRLIYKATALKNYYCGHISVVDGVVRHKSRPVDNEQLTKRILTHMELGYPFGSLVKFLGLLLKNPDKRCKDSLYCFMEQEQLPINEQGYIIAYKSLREDLRDWYSNSVQHKVGQTVYWGQRKSERKCAPLHYGEECSNKGYHVGTHNYAKTFNSPNVVCLVKVNPADVISVPDEGSMGKIRVKKYRVEALYKDDKPIQASFHSTQRNRRARKIAARRRVAA
jgi:hypothetical protein